MSEQAIVEQVMEKTLSLPDRARAIVVTDNESYQAAGEMLKAVKGLRKEISDTFKPIKQRIDESKKEVLAKERQADAPLVEVENYLKPQIARYLSEQERIRREEERRKQEEARKAAEEAQLAEAEVLEREGRHEEAEAVLSEETHVAPVVEPKTTPKLAGVSFRKVWKFRIVDVAKIPREYLVPDEVKIGGVVRALKDAANIPGIEVYPEDSVAAGAR